MLACVLCAFLSLLDFPQCAGEKHCGQSVAGVWCSLGFSGGKPRPAPHPPFCQGLGEPAGLHLCLLWPGFMPASPLMDANHHALVSLPWKPSGLPRTGHVGDGKISRVATASQLLPQMYSTEEGLSNIKIWSLHLDRLVRSLEKHIQILLKVTCQIKPSTC